MSTEIRLQLKSAQTDSLAGLLLKSNDLTATEQNGMNKKTRHRPLYTLRSSAASKSLKRTAYLQCARLQYASNATGTENYQISISISRHGQQSSLEGKLKIPLKGIRAEGGVGNPDG